MLRLWSRKRVLKVLPNRPSTTLHMATILLSTVLNMFTKLLAPRAPKRAFAFEVALPDEEAIQLIHTCAALKTGLNIQLAAIGKIPSAPNEHVVSRLHQIQIRHTDIQIRLAMIISQTKGSTTLWVREFGDSHAALERKIVTINSRSRALGWINIAIQCWPEVAVTYEWLLPIVSRLQDELRRALKQKELCVTDKLDDSAVIGEEVGGERKQDREAFINHRRVHFAQEAMVREYETSSTIGEQSFNKQSFAVLSDRSKTTWGRFREKKLKSEFWLSDSEL